jgi:hypothetical protein
VVRICSHSGGRFPNPFGLHYQKVAKITSLLLDPREWRAFARSAAAIANIVFLI